jgi:hypothetical protein
MSEHTLKIGQLVDYRPKVRFASTARGPYQIKQRMPSDDGEFRWRIKSPHEAHERVVNESDLSSP